MYIKERQNLFRNPKNQSNPYRIMLLLLVIVVLVAVLRSYAQGAIWPPFIPTPTPTRTINSGKVPFWVGCAVSVMAQSPRKGSPVHGSGSVNTLFENQSTTFLLKVSPCLMSPV